MTTKQYPHYVKAVHVIPSQGVEVHMVGEMVAVKWQIRRTTVKKTIIEDGLEYTAELIKTIREGKPYISFETVRTVDGEVYLDDDNPVTGGLNLKAAQQLADELQKAVDYLAFIETMEKIS